MPIRVIKAEVPAAGPSTDHFLLVPFLPSVPSLQPPPSSKNTWQGARNAAGLAHGQGLMVLDNGERVEGACVDGVMQGPVVLTKPDGTRIDGAYVGGKWHGKLVGTRSNGTTIEYQYDHGTLVSQTVRSPPQVCVWGIGILAAALGVRCAPLPPRGGVPGGWGCGQWEAGWIPQAGRKAAVGIGSTRTTS